VLNSRRPIADGHCVAGIDGHPMGSLVFSGMRIKTPEAASLLVNLNPREVALLVPAGVPQHAHAIPLRLFTASCR